MAHFILSYDLAPDYLERRGTFRAEHLTLAWEAAERGDLLLGGALGDPVEAAMLLFTGDGPEAAEAFARADPYVISGIVRSWRVLPWTTVVGDAAATPVRGQ
ncbi:YciI-like protein [Sphingomonas crocodyli]|uniref:YCII-related domain-containing protein n=1 Tax=Sphingomonas crocodyli TaxID=1979270 RepID=A0A437MB38_9SPHN|nr:YciI-like protein [Sphingomonas crocodyli]RVT94845.1 hypothetical protein EOD43_13825 [Sphingomonas crocodyli]